MQSVVVGFLSCGGDADVVNVDFRRLSISKNPVANRFEWSVKSSRKLNRHSHLGNILDSSGRFNTLSPCLKTAQVRIFKHQQVGLEAGLKLLGN
ncbi:hypothetical protein D9M70_641490 [compost metagenome]